MLLVNPMACLMLAWPAVPAIPDAPKDVPALRRDYVYEVMQIKSGVEILVKRDRKEITVRLLGIDTPEVAQESKVNVLSQMKFLRGLIEINGMVSLEPEPGASPDATGHLLAHVRRSSDGMWLNMDMIELGFATTAKNRAFPAQAEFAAAEQVAKDCELGMWASDFLDHAAHPWQFVRNVRRHHFVPRFLAFPPGPALGQVPSRPSSSESGKSDNDDASRRQQEQDREARSRRETSDDVRTGRSQHDYPVNAFINHWPNSPSYFPNTSGGYTAGGTMGPYGGTVIPGAGTPSGSNHAGLPFGFIGGGFSGGSSSGSSGSSGPGSSGSSGSMPPPHQHQHNK